MDFINRMELQDMPKMGRSYTWTNNQDMLTDSELGRVIMQGFRIKVNSGSATKFWDQLWLGDEVLKSVVVPSLYIISTQEEAMLKDVMGIDRAPPWNLQFRRNLFVWEGDKLRRLRR